ncbi:uncharacterized protein LOC110989739 [Acanthaster planci]|uniref:Uncharacterized protein LOC110989739 n=1 Tax=Acanthaster planci TaxID=133434 RepID=A0A8B7ZY47_ACAPL|nr:uncharacterized protein LOC110989739 [Acanthaster planci]XP_022110017.1 uncharacterized protein LOC110989739 [Acanthaster planci]
MTVVWKLVALAAAFATVSSLALTEPNLEVLPSKEEQLLQLFSEDLADMTPQEIAKFFLVDFKTVHESEVIGKGASGSCKLGRHSAECCGKLSFKVFLRRINLDACVFVEVLTRDYGLHIKIKALGKTLLDKEVSAREPPSICVGVPKVKLADICLDLYDVQWRGGFHACLALEVHVAFLTVLDVTLGCIDI